MRNSKHTREFRDSAIQLVLNSNEEIKDLAEDLGVNPKTLYNWVYNYKKDNNLQTNYRNDNNKSTTKESLDEENRRLRKENRLLKQERDILKKATAYFAKETL
jgi:transposase